MIHILIVAKEKSRHGVDVDSQARALFSSQALADYI